MAERTVPAESPVADVVEVFPARPVDLRRAAKLGLVAGMSVVFVSANGMVEAFSEREVLGSLTLASLVLLSVPLLVGYFAGRPPAVLQGFAAARPGWRNVEGGVLAGVLCGFCVAVFAVVIDAFDVRGVLVNVSPQLVREDPRLLTFGLALAPGVVVVLALNSVLGGFGGSLHLVPGRWRGALFAATLWMVAFGMLQPLIAQVLQGIQTELRIWTAPLIDFMYGPSGALTVPGAVLVAAVSFIVYALLKRGNGKPVRARIERMPDRRRLLLRLAVGAVLLFLLALLPQVIGPFLSEVLNIAGIFLLMALGLNIVVGFAGLLDLGYVAFFAVGAYVTALLTSPQSSLGVGWVFWAAVPFVILAAAVSGLLVGTPVLRMRGDYLAIVTLGFGEIARLLFLSDWLKPIFGGAQGIIRVPDITLGPIEISGPQAFFYLILVFVLLATYASYSLQNSRIGRAWMAMREDESVAEATGVNIVTAKLSAFIVGAMFAGFGGALFATKIGSVFPHSFSVIVSITILVVIIVGGLASVPGVILGALVLVGLPELLREFEEYRFLIYGALLIFMMRLRPEGLLPSKRRAEELHEEDAEQDAWLRTRAAEQREAATPEPGETG